MTRRQSTGVLAVSCGLALAVSPARTALSSLVLPSNGTPAAPAAGSSAPRPAMQTLNASELSRVRDALLRDGMTRQILEGRDYRVTRVGPWTTTRGALIGASLVVGLRQPASFSMTRWPVIDYGHAEQARQPYTQSKLQMAARNVTEIMVRVDLSGGAVVGVEPSGPHAVIVGGPDVKPIRPATPGY